MDGSTPVSGDESLQKSQKKADKQRYIDTLVTIKDQKCFNCDLESYREKLQDYSTMCLAAKVAKHRLSDKDFSVVESYVDYVCAVNSAKKGKSNSYTYLLYDTPVEDAQKFLEDEKIRVIDDLKMIGDEVCIEDDLAELGSQLHWRRCSIISHLSCKYNISDDDLLPLSTKELFEKKMFLEKQEKDEKNAREQKKKYTALVDKSTKLKKYYGVHIEHTEDSTELEFRIQKAAETAQILQIEREEEQNLLKSTLIDRIVKNARKFTGVFGEEGLDCEIDEIFTLQQLYDVFLNITVKTPKVSSILSEKPEYVDYNSTGILFNVLFHNRGRFFNDAVGETFAAMYVTNKDVPLLRSKMFEFVLKEMMNDGRVRLLEDSTNERYVKMVNEIELYVICSGTGGGSNTLTVHNSHPDIMTENVVRFVQYVDRDQKQQLSDAKLVMNKAVDKNCIVM